MAAQVCGRARINEIETPAADNAKVPDAIARTKQNVFLTEFSSRRGQT